MASKCPATPANGKKNIRAASQADVYRHPTASSPLRPDVGTQAQFKKKKAPQTFRYDSSLSPEMDWDGQDHARDLGEWLLAQIEQAAALPPPHVFLKPHEFKNSTGQVAVKVIDLRGNELLVVKSLKEAEA